MADEARAAGFGGGAKRQGRTTPTLPIEAAKTMTFIEWSLKLSVNVHELDEQHKTLIAGLNEFYGAMLQGKSKELIGKTIEELCKYSTVHFTSEENLLKLHEFAEYEEQKKEHEYFSKHVLELQEKHRNGELIFAVDIFKFLFNWIHDHLLYKDKKYGPYLNSKGVY